MSAYLKSPVESVMDFTGLLFYLWWSDSPPHFTHIITEKPGAFPDRLFQSLCSFHARLPAR
nr:MAG TPA: hypothetical protein [Caudoviricetes sp.]